MNVKEAITLACKKEKFEKETRRKNNEFRTNIPNVERIKDKIIRNHRKEAFGKLIEKASKINAELREGILYLESRGKRFTLYHERKTALYLYSDGALHIQTWGMYLGSNNVRKVTPDMFDSFDFEMILALVDIDFRTMLIEQIVRCRK